MIFVDDISLLQYYNAPEMGCYCELVMEPEDLSMQVQLPNNGSSTATYNITVEQYSVDGITMEADVTANFEWVAFISPDDGMLYVNIRGTKFTTEFCSNPCFILKVTVRMVQGGVVNVIFSKFTEQWCMDSCCYGQIGDIEVRAGSSDGQIIYSGDGI